MSLLVESMKLRDGQIQNLEYHQNRLNRSMDEICPGKKHIDLSGEIVIPENCRKGLFKVRVLYSDTIEKIEFAAYTFRTIQSLKIVRHESVDYHLKYADRAVLQELFARRGNCDDIIIVKNGLVTDSFAANLVFFNGENWVTPDLPLLKGIKRQYLLDNGIITAKKIREDDLKSFQKAGLVNAMIDFEKMPVISIEKIVY